MKNEFDILNDAKVDFSKYNVTELNEKELTEMKNLINPSHKKTALARAGAIAACAALIAAFSQTSFAKELMDNIIKSLSTGHNSYYQYDPEGMSAEIPEQYRIFYDENGKLAAEYTDGITYYDADGNKIDNPEKYLNEYLAEISGDENELTFSIGDAKDPLEKLRSSEIYTVTDSEDGFASIGEKLDFKPVLPEKLPEGYRFHGAAYFGTDGRYLFVYYTNGKGEYIIVDETLIDDETKFSMGTDAKLDEVEINGSKAVYSENNALYWENNGVSFGLIGKSISRSELFDMAESMK